MPKQTKLPTFIGTKMITAVPMTRQMYNDYRGWTLPDNEDGTDSGYLVEYLDGGQANDPRHKGYISWSPSAVFENSYRRTDGMSFGLAIEAMKLGLKVCRAGWNGKGMWIILVPGSENIKPVVGTPYSRAGITTEVQILPHIDMYTVDSTGRRAMLPGWLASQTDMLSDDWMIVD